MKTPFYWFRSLSLIVLLIVTGVSGKIMSQTTPDGSTPQFLFPDFTMSSVRMKNGQHQKILLNYNTVTEKMVYSKEEDLYDMVNTEMVDTVYLQDSKFVPVGKAFYEVLLVAPVALLVQYTGSLIPPGTPAGYGGTSQVSNTKQLSSVELSSGYYNLKLPGDYSVKVDPVYWVRNDNSMTSFINERQFLKIFPESEIKLKKYIKENKIKFSRLSDIVKLAGYCNEIIK